MSSESHAEALLSADDVARLLGLTRKTVYRLTQAGDLRHVRINKTVRFEPAAVRAYVESHRCPA